MSALAATSSASKRKLASTLSPTQAHELDVVRAARMGIDISWMAPDERCKYPSKFCCNKRVKKSTGKLHRFCEEHRARAKVNQKRWTEVRRRQDQTREALEANLAAYAATEAWMDLTKPLLAPALPACSPMLPLLAPLVIPTPSEEAIMKEEPSSPTNVDVDALGEEELPLSETDIDMLTTFVAQCEQSTEPMTVEDAWLMSMLQESDESLLGDWSCDSAISVL